MTLSEPSTTQGHLPAILSTGFALWLFTLPASAADTLSPEARADNYPSETQYIIRRKGKKVGKHTVAFTKGPSQLRVDVASNITITVLKVPVFKFTYTATEQWENGVLARVEARTNNGGDITNAEFVPGNADTVAHSSNHWNADVLSSTEVFNTLTGNISRVTIEPIGRTTLRNGDAAVEADGYRYSGDIQADVWYDEEERWVKLEFRGEDGSVISYTADPLDFSQ